MNKKMLIILAVAAVLIAAASTVVAIGMNNARIPGDVIRINEGKTERIFLEENPSTGYMWTLVNPEDGVIELVGDYYAEGPARPGAAGQHIWKIRGASKGETTLTFSYERSWAENSSIETKTYTIIVD